MVTMATNGTGATAAFTPVLAAMSTMRDGQREQKKAAHQFLESFQKSVGYESTNMRELCEDHRTYRCRRLRRGKSLSDCCNLKQTLKLSCSQLQR